MKKGWNFPDNNNGQIVGISEAGIETFKGSPIPSLAREICQNSLDARANKELPVTVEFSLNIISVSEIDRFDELKKALYLCKDFWTKNKNDKTINFFDKASKAVDEKLIRVLRISDFNTTGLTGSKQKYNTPWQNLVKSSGVSDKSGSSGGSFGIGKSAPFVCSDIRTVMYSTIDTDDIKASQGVARLVSFEYPSSSVFKKEYITQGIGYYGNTDNNSALDELITFGGYTRDTPGTDVYIIGFIDSEEWIDDIIKALLDCFLISIMKKDLVVKIEKHTIDILSIGIYIEKYKSTAELAYNYYQVLTSDKTIRFTENFKELGNITLYVLLNSELKRKVLVTRKNGMKIFDKNNISSTIYFAGVLELEDEHVNAYFRAMETPQHDDWQPDRHSNPKEAKKYKSELFKWVKAKIIEVGRDISTDEVDAEGLGDYLPDEAVASSINESEKRIETLENKVKNIEISPVKNISVNKGFQHIENTGIEGEIEVPGFFDDEGADGTAFTPQGDSNDTSGGKGSPSSGKEDGNSTSIIKKTVSIKPIYVRLYMSDYTNKQYTLIFSPEESAKQSYIQLSVSGEQSNIKINVKSSCLTNTPSISLNCRDNKILIGDIIAKTKVSINYEINYDDACSMEVNLYGIKV